MWTLLTLTLLHLGEGVWKHKSLLLHQPSHYCFWTLQARHTRRAGPTDTLLHPKHSVLKLPGYFFFENFITLVPTLDVKRTKCWSMWSILNNHAMAVDQITSTVRSLLFLLLSLGWDLVSKFMVNAVISQRHCISFNPGGTFMLLKYTWTKL